MSPLPPDWFARPTLEVARDLLGNLLVYERPGVERLVGRIVETEGYLADDPAMHGWRATFGPEGRVQPVGRAESFFGPPGRAYVYRCYFTAWLLNVVTEREGVPGAVLIRAVEPLEGLATMQAHRPDIRRAVDLTNGPGKLTQAFGVDDEAFHGADLTRPPLYLAEDDATPPAHVAVSSRIGLSKGVDRPYRFYVARHPYVSPGVPSDVRVARKAHRERRP